MIVKKRRVLGWSSSIFVLLESSLSGFLKGKGEGWEHERASFLISAWNRAGIIFWGALIKVKTYYEITNLKLMWKCVSSIIHHRRDTGKRKNPRGPSLHVAFELTEFFECSVLREKKGGEGGGVQNSLFQEYQDVWCYAVEVSSYCSRCQVSLSTVWKYRKEILQFYPWKLACITISSWRGELTSPGSTFVALHYCAYGSRSFIHSVFQLRDASLYEV